MNVELITPNFSSDHLHELLSYRGVTDINHFLFPDYSCLQSPNDLVNIDKGAAVLLNTIKNRETILLIIDPDTDGVTSGAIFYLYIKKIAPDIQIDYLIHNGKQHGLEDHMDYLLNCNKHYGLIVQPDSGSADYNYHEQLKTNILILDHHDIEEGQKISEYAVVINNQISPDYKNKDLTGAGVTWQFCRYIDQMLNTNFANELIDLAALGICGDMGSILNLENRYIMQTGFNNITNFFFQKAVEKQAYSMQNTVNATTVAFYIVPLINAMIRVGSLEEKERLFKAFIDGEELIESKKRGAKGTKEMAAIESLRECTNAKSKQTRITDNMVDILESRIFKYDLLSHQILFVRLTDEDDFPNEVTGLIAMKLSVKFQRPTIVARLNSQDNYIRGSLRNFNGSPLEDFKQFLNDSGFFEYAQGHASAAGVSISASALGSFHDYADKVLADYNFNESTYKVDFKKKINSLDLYDLIMDIGQYEDIWGQDNSVPIIFIDDFLLDKKDVQIIGAKQDTLKFTINNITYIKFRANELIELLRENDTIRICLTAKPNLNKFMGNITPQLMIENYEATPYDKYAF